jgi:hypothetical protein
MRRILWNHVPVAMRLVHERHSCSQMGQEKTDPKLLSPQSTDWLEVKEPGRVFLDCVFLYCEL